MAYGGRSKKRLQVHSPVRRALQQSQQLGGGLVFSGQQPRTALDLLQEVHGQAAETLVGPEVGGVLGDPMPIMFRTSKKS